MNFLQYLLEDEQITEDQLMNFLQYLLDDEQITEDQLLTGLPPVLAG